MKRTTVVSTLALMRADKEEGKLKAEEILTKAGCQIFGMFIGLPDEGVKVNRLTNAAFALLLDDYGYKTCDIRKDNPVEV